jgi:pimeloyl-ACP methyl ester carboxylesterase
MDLSNQTIKLKDGRTLGFAEYGDKKGKPVIYLHGWPATRLNAAIYDSLANKLHVHVIAPDRPGFGLSDFKKDRKMLDWPDDIIELANHFKIKKFAVMGVSGGGPYAAVCAYKIPKRLTNVGIVVGLGPIRGPESLRGVMWMGKIGWLNFHKHPWIAKGSAFLQSIKTRYNFFPGLNRYFWSKEDRKLLADPLLGNRLTETMRDAFRTGYKGPELDLKLYTDDWGFDLTGIRANVYLWYGDKDQCASPAMGEYYAEVIPKSKLIMYQGEGHLVSITHATEIFKTLLS